MIIMLVIIIKIQAYSGWTFWGFTDWGEGKKASLREICHIYPTIIKLGTVVLYI